MGMGYAGVPGVCGRYEQLRVRPLSWSGVSVQKLTVEGQQQLQRARVGYSLHLDWQVS